MCQVQVFAAGYFLWDLQISTQYMSIAGVSSILHAIGALVVTYIGFVSHQMTQTESKANCRVETLRQLPWPLLRALRALHTLPKHPLVLRQARHDPLEATLYNGIALLVTFFGCRIVWGTYSSILIYSDICKALTLPSNDPMASLLNNDKCEGNTIILDGPGCEVGDLPMWLVSMYLLGNTALSSLNFY